MEIDFSRLPESVEITDVTLRDGLQNENTLINTQDKIKIIKKIVEAGVNSLEVTSFVRLDLVPQLADAEELFKQLPKYAGCNYRALVPNLKGYAKAIKAGCKTIVLFVSATEEHNRKNLGRSVKDTLAAYDQVVERAKSNQVRVIAAISMAFEKTSEKLEDILDFFRNTGISHFILCDTSGTANPRLVAERLAFVKQRLNQEDVALHFHDTTGCAMANVLVSLAIGFNKFDAAIGGLGGCPFAQGAAGNISLEDLVWFLESLNVNTGIDMEKLLHVNSILSGLLRRPLQDSKVARYLRGEKGSCLQ